MPNICSYVEMYGIVLYSPDRSLKPGEVGIYWNNDMISTYRPAVCFSAQGISACIHLGKATTCSCAEGGE